MTRGPYLLSGSPTPQNEPCPISSLRMVPAAEAEANLSVFKPDEELRPDLRRNPSRNDRFP